jgi:hypothetical protein
VLGRIEIQNARTAKEKVVPRIKSLLNCEVSNVRADIAREMIKLGVATALDPLDTSEGSRLPKYQPAAVPEPSWEVCVHNGSQGAKTLCIRMTLPNVVVDYTGSPADANRRLEWQGGGRWLNGFGREVPTEILKIYNRQYKDNPSLRGIGGWCLPPGTSTGPSNETMAFVQKEYDNAVAHGSVPYSGGTKVIG